MKKQLLTLLFLATASAGYAQVKIGNNPSTIDPSSVLELESPNKALYMVRVSLSSTTDVTTVAAPKAGMVVYNTNPLITGLTATPGGIGLYYYDGTQWVGTGSSGSNFIVKNGVTRVGDTIKLGGVLTQPTTISTSVTNTFSITGLQGGSASDSVVTVDPITGVFRYRSVGAILANIKANNGLTRNADSIQLGGTLTKPTTINTSATNTLAITGLQSGSGLDSIVVVNPITGVAKYRSVSAILANIKANNGLTRNGDSIQLGGTLTHATTINTSATNTLAITGLQSGSSSDSVMVVDPVTGITKYRSTSAILSNIKANNGLTRNADSIQLGGTLTHATTINTSATNTLAITGLQSGSASDSVMVVDPVTGITKYRSTSAILSNIKANNGLTRVGDSIQLGGTLTKATTIATSVTNTLAITGLQGGSVSDSILTVNPITGITKYRSAASLTSNINANNGLTRVGDSIQLGGTLTKVTTINQNGNDFNFTNGNVSIGGRTTTNTLAITNLGSGSASDSIVTFDPVTGLLRKRSVSSFSFPSSDAWKLLGNAGTSAATNFVGTTDNVSLNFRVNNVASGKIGTTADSVTLFGYQAGISNTSTGNTFVGFNAGTTNTTGRDNTALGNSANMFSNNLTNATAIGAYAVVNDNDKVRIGNTLVRAIEGQVAFSFPSDGRFKKNVSTTGVPGLSFIMGLRPVTYNFDYTGFSKFLGEKNVDPEKAAQREKEYEIGFIAQEVEKLVKETGVTFNGVIAPRNAKDNYSVSYAHFVMPLVKAVQEQEAIITNQQQQINNLQQQIDELKALIKK